MQQRIQQVAREARHWIAFFGWRKIVTSVCGLVGVAVIGWLMFRPSPVPVESVMPRVQSSVSQTVSAEMHVHVAGAVKKPGVYVLPPQSRVVDAVAAAGGSLPQADLETINLAQTLLDAEQVFIPSKKVSRPRVTVAPRLRPQPRTSNTSVSDSKDTKTININTATVGQLESLTGVGPATAKAIISYRSSKGSFTKVEDLLNVPGIGPAKLAAMRNEISVG